MLLTDRFAERDPLAPARWNGELEKGEFDEPFPWKILFGFLGIVLVMAFGHLQLQAKRLDDLRAAIYFRLETELEPLEARFSERALSIEPWLGADSFGGPALRASDLSFEALREGGLISVRQGPPDGRGEGAMAVSDELGDCLGLPSASLPRLRAGLRTFGPELREEIAQADHFLKLRALQDQIDRKLDALVPELALAAGARYLLLSEEDREARELIVFLVDLEGNDAKLRTRVPYDGRLLTARVMLDIALRDKTPGAIRLPTELPKGASDCAAASALRDAIEGRNSIAAKPVAEGRELSAE